MRVLLVEDDRRVARFVSRGLSDELHAVTTVETGPDGLEYALTNEFDVIILDLALPGMGGIDLCAELRSRGLTTPILVLSAMLSVDTKVDALMRGADDYLTKPFEFDELLARLEVLYRRRTHGLMEQPTMLTVGDLVLDVDAMEVWHGSKKIVLTNKEVAILKFLMSAPNTVISRSRILSHVWGVDADPLTNVVDVYIGRLRKKIDGLGRTKFIETIRGRGYRVRDNLSGLSEARP